MNRLLSLTGPPKDEELQGAQGFRLNHSMTGLNRIQSNKKACEAFELAGLSGNPGSIYSPG
jgi:hypothetical protein